MTGNNGLLLNLGCADDILEGWVNVDITPGPGVTVAALAAEPAAPPLLDGLEASSARVYELGGDGLALVMVVDASLDV